MDDVETGQIGWPCVGEAAQCQGGNAKPICLLARIFDSKSRAAMGDHMDASLQRLVRVIEIRDIFGSEHAIPRSHGLSVVVYAMIGSHILALEPIIDCTREHGATIRCEVRVTQGSNKASRALGVPHTQRGDTVRKRCRHGRLGLLNLIDVHPKAGLRVDVARSMLDLSNEFNRR